MTLTGGRGRMATGDYSHRLLVLALLGLATLLALLQTFRLYRSFQTVRTDTELYEINLRLQHVLELAQTASDTGPLQSEFDSLLRQYQNASGRPAPTVLSSIQVQERSADSLRVVGDELDRLRGAQLSPHWGDTRENIWLATLLWLLALVISLFRAKPEPSQVNKRSPRDSDDIEVPLSVTHMALEARESFGGRSPTSVRGYTERVLRSLSNLLILTGPEGDIQMVNDAVCWTLEYERGELLGLPHGTLLDSDLTELEHGTRNMETNFRTKSGAPLPVLVSCSPVYGADDELEGLVIVAQDISERKETERSLQASERRLRNLMERLQSAQEQERQKVARDLHDGMLQLVIAAEMQLTASRKKMDPKGEQSGLGQGIECLSEAVKEGRRLIQNLRPPSLDKFGLVQSIRMEALKLSRELECESEFNFEIEETELPSAIENTVFRICQEAMNNIRKHAHPKKISILMKMTHGSLVVTVEDDGKGFDQKDDSFVSGVGLHSMRERAELQGGNLECHSAPGQGTRITAVIPLEDI